MTKARKDAYLQVSLKAHLRAEGGGGGGGGAPPPPPPPPPQSPLPSVTAKPLKIKA